jgi:hypothetical protein
MDKHIFIPDMQHGNCCCIKCMPKSTAQMDEERAAKLAPKEGSHD